MFQITSVELQLRPQDRKYTGTIHKMDDEPVHLPFRVTDNDVVARHPTLESALRALEDLRAAELHRQAGEVVSGYGPPVVRFPLLHSGNAHAGLVAEMERSGDAGVYSEARLGVLNPARECVADVLVGYSESGELRILLTTGGDGEGDHSHAFFPMRPTNMAVERFDG